MLKGSYPVSSDGILQKFKLIHAFMYVLVTYKNEDDQMKNEGARVITLYSYNLDAEGQLVGGWLEQKIKRIPAFMVVLVICKNEKIQSENEGVRVVTILPINF